MCFRKKYKSLKEIRIDVFESHYKKREKNCARLIKYFSKYPDMFEQFDQEELKTLKAYCYISYQGSFVYRCQKIKEYLFPQIKQYVNGERELGSLESLSSVDIRRELDWLERLIYSENYPEEYGFINCLISFSELNTWRGGRIDSDEQIKNAGEIFNKGKKFVDKETVDVFQKMFDIFGKKNSSTRTGSILYNYGKYEGEIVWDKPNGQGKFTYDEGSSYEGQFKDGVRQGFGVYKYASGSRFEGQYKNDQPNGFGKMFHNDGDRFEGMYKDGVRNGHGTYYYSNGDVLEGDFYNDVSSGPFKFYVYDKKTKKIKEREEGTFRLGSLSGVVKVFVEKNGKDCLDLFRIYEDDQIKMEIKYETLRKTNRHNEFGAMRYYKDSIQPSYKPRGKCKKIIIDDKRYYYGEYTYNSDFGADIMHGFGTIYNSDGIRIEGEFEDARMLSGSIFSDKGDKVYHGQLKSLGIFNGYGVLYAGDNYVEGYFSEGTLDKTLPYVVRTDYEDGTIYEGEVFDGMYHGKGYIVNKKEGKIMEFVFDNGRSNKKYRLYYKDGSYEDIE